MSLRAAARRRGNLERDQVKRNPVNHLIARPTVNLWHDHVSVKHDHALGPLAQHLLSWIAARTFVRSR